MLKIILVPNDILATATKPVTEFDSGLQKIIGDMKKALLAQTDPIGVGLAAPQVNINQQIFIIKPGRKSKISVFINPKILKSVKMKKNKIIKTKKNTPLEGCLSIPHIWGPVKRSKKILLNYQTETGEQKEKWFTNFEAVIIQHEMDHLNGILFTQRVLEQKNQLYEEKDGKLQKIEY